MAVNEVKTIFMQEFSRMNLSGYELRNTFIVFCNDLFEAGEISFKVYCKCLRKV